MFSKLKRNGMNGTHEEDKMEQILMGREKGRNTSIAESSREF